MTSPLRWLGSSAKTPTTIEAEVIDAIPRGQARAELGNELPPWEGADYWNCYEASYLSQGGVPRRLTLSLKIPCDSPFIPESKSLKLYLASAHHQKFSDNSAFIKRIQADLGERLQTSGIDVRSNQQRPPPPPAADLDKAAQLSDFDPGPSPHQRAQHLRADNAFQRWSTPLFRSLCPVTGQPDWARVTIVSDPGLEPGSLLSYLLSYRSCNDFHEACCERIFADIWQRLSPTRLGVAMYFLRRGGIEINPVRVHRLSGMDANPREHWQ